MLSRSSKGVAATVLLIAATSLTLVSAVVGQNARWGANYFPNVVLTTQDGKKVHFYDDLLKGKVVAINLIYTHCKDVCPLETARIAQVQRLLGDRVGKEIFIYSISIDPENDTPEVLKRYAENFHAGPGWLFLTGKKEDIDLISKKIGLFSDPSSSRDGHSAYLLIGNEATGQWMRNSATDNPRFLAVMIGDWLNSWKSTQTRSNSYSQAGALSVPNEGQYVFATHCSACHTVGRGDAIGPDLLGVTKRRDPAWLKRFISVPDTMLDNGDQQAMQLFKQYKQVRMPNLALSDSDVNAVIGFLESQSTKSVNVARGNEAAHH